MHISSSDSPGKVDSFLADNYGFSLWEFTSCLDQLLHIEYGKKSRNYSISIIKEEVKKLRNIKISLIKRLDKHQRNLKFALKQTDSIKKYKLRPLINEIEKEISYLNWSPGYHPRGDHPQLVDHLKFHNLVAAIWAQIIRKDKLISRPNWILIKEIETKRIDWSIIADLLDWFKIRLEETKYSVFLKSDFDPDILRRQYYKFIRSQDHKDLIIGELLCYMLPWAIYFREVLKDPSIIPKKYRPVMPKKFPPLMIKISKNKIEHINMNKLKPRNRHFIVFPTGETLP